MRDIPMFLVKIGWQNVLGRLVVPFVVLYGGNHPTHQSSVYHCIYTQATDIFIMLFDFQTFYNPE